MSPRKKKSGSTSPGDDDDYKKKRERNNKAVKACRAKSIQTAKKIKEETDNLRNKNAELKGNIKEKERNITSLLEILLSSSTSDQELADIRRIMEPLRGKMTIDPELYQQLFGLV